MSRHLILAALVIGTAAGAQSRTTTCTPKDRDCRPAPLLELTPGGAGVSQAMAAPLDVLFAGEMTGTWFSLRGDGTTAGTLALAEVGTPIDQTDTILPCGPNGCARVSQRVDGANSRFATTNQGIPTADFSVCAVFNHDALPASASYISKNNGNTFALSYNAGAGGVQFYVNAAAIQGGLPRIGAWHFACGTYDFVANGTSVAKVYLDGAQTATSSTMPGPPNTTSAPFVVGNWGNLTSPFAGRIAAAFYTEKVLDPTTIANMNAAVHAQVQTTRGEVLSTTRAGVMYCCEGSSCALLPPNRACPRSGGLEAMSSAVNSALRFNEFNNAVWVPTHSVSGLPVVTADIAIAPDGTKTADRIVFPAVNGATDYSIVRQTLASGAYTENLWMQSCAGSGAQNVYLANGGQVSNPSTLCATTETTWTNCSVTAPDSPTDYFDIGTNRNMTGQIATAAQCVYVWGAQANTGGYAAPPCPTTTAAAGCDPPQTTLTKTFPSTSSGWSYAVTVRPRYNANAGAWGGGGGVYQDGNNRTQAYLLLNNTVACSHLSTGAGVTAQSTSAVFLPGVPVRIACSFNAVTKTITAYYDGKPGAPVTNAAATHFTPIGFQSSGLPTFSGGADGAVVSDHCYDPTPDGCR